MPVPRSGAAGDPLHLHARVVEAGAGADVGQRVGRQGVGRRAVQRVAAPQSLRQRHGSRPHRGRHRRVAGHRPEIVEHPHRVAVADLPRMGIVRVDRRARPACATSSPSDDVIGLLARRRDQRQRIPVRRRVGLVACRGPAGAWRSRSSGKRWTLPSGVRGNTSTNWTGAVPNRRRRRRIRADRLADALGKSVDDAQHHLQLVARLAGSVEAEPLFELGEHLDVGAGLADRVDDGLHHLQADRPVARAKIVLLEERRRRQHDVGVARRVGHHLVEDDRRTGRRARAPAARGSGAGPSPSGLQL